MVEEIISINTTPFSSASKSVLFTCFIKWIVLQLLSYIKGTLI